MREKHTDGKRDRKCGGVWDDLKVVFVVVMACACMFVYVCVRAGVQQ